MSTEAGCTHLGSKGSMPIRPASIAARMSRSESTTATEYAALRAPQFADGDAEFTPGAHAPLGVGQGHAREAPEHLDRVRARGPSHRDIRRAVADDHGF